MHIHTNRLPPTELLAIKRLLVRLPERHKRYEEFRDKEYRIEAGYSGELAVDRVLHEIEFPRDIQILKGVKLRVNPHYSSQIDTLILFSSRAVILEIKNYSGTIYFDEESGKTIRISSTGKRDEFDCIIHQLLRARDALRQWLVKRNCNLPIEGVIVMANQRTLIPEMPTTVPVKYRKQLPRYIKELPDLPAVLSSWEIKLIAEEIRKSQVMESNNPACEMYKIHPGELRKGVLCPVCNESMNRKQGRKWRCGKCGDYGNQGFSQSMADWFLLIKSTISNRECREFLNLTSKYSASVALRESKLKRQGNPPKTYYTWDYKTRLYRK